MSEDEKVSVSQILDNVKTHEKALQSFQQDHCCKARCIEDKAQETFQQRYMVSCFSRPLFVFTFRRFFLFTSKLSLGESHRSMSPQGQLRLRVNRRSQPKPLLNHFEQSQWSQWLKRSAKTTLMNPLRRKKQNRNS